MTILNQATLKTIFKCCNHYTIHLFPSLRRQTPCSNSKHLLYAVDHKRLAIITHFTPPDQARVYTPQGTSPDACERLQDKLGQTRVVFSHLYTSDVCVWSWTLTQNLTSTHFTPPMGMFVTVRVRLRYVTVRLNDQCKGVLRESSLKCI